ncbi:hypothetical protein H2203_006851 [Taxawa tesnikishii (nom. ined.)]|nr:hypothetical protein H2203_006851 [Dothideales sp. JES 119]
MDAVSIQEANKIRAALGMAPLPVPGEAPGLSFKESKDDGDESDESDHVSTLEKRQAAAGNNWKKLQDEERARADRIARKEAAKKQREAAQRFSKLEGKGLGETEGPELDTRSWLLQQKKRQKKIEQARKYEEEQAAREKQAEYTSKDLAGVKVGHELDQFGEGGEQILTLKDAEIGDEDEEDELENLDLRAQEKLVEKLELKKKKPVYNPNEVEETGQKSILAHYDEEIDGKKRKRFTLDGQGSSAEVAAAVVGSQEEPSSKGIKVSLDILKDDTPVSDYADPSTAKIRKPKKKKAKTTRQKAADEDDIFPVEPEPVHAPKVEGGAMDVDSAPANGNLKKRTFEFDDDDLQAKLAEQRRQALKKRKKTDAAELARQIREEASATPATFEAENGEEDEPGMVIDETTEFVSNLQRPAEPEERRATIRNAGMTPSPEPDRDGDTQMAQSYAAVEDEEDLKARLKREEETPGNEVTATGFEEEETFTQGLGASLSMLRKRGLVKDTAAAEQNAKDRAREEFLAKNQSLIAEYDATAREQRERDRNSGRWEHMSAREREAYARQENERREQYLASLQAEHFRKNYRPDVKLKYNDEFGREMNQKEAFKHLSHQFHGKGSGKQKTEKRLKKIKDEKKRDAMSALDASQHTGMNSAMGATARKNRTAGVRLQ